MAHFSYILGTSDEDIICTGIEETHQLTLEMILQTQRRLDILTHHFAPALYDTPEMFDAFEQLALRSRHTQIRIILHHPQTAVHQGHQIINLGKRLTSYFKFRKLPETHHHLSETFLIADQIGMMHYPYPDSLKAQVNFNDPLNTSRLVNTFNQLWELSETHPDLTPFIL